MPLSPNLKNLNIQENHTEFRKIAKPMEHVNQKDLREMEKIFRRNLVHSCTGYKSANLIGTASSRENSDLAVFNSVFHLGSQPPILGCIVREGTVPKSTYQHIINTGFFTVNHIHKDMVEQAHQTTAAHEPEISGFKKGGFDKEYLDDFPAPYVRQSLIKMGCKLLNQYHIKENNTRLLVAAIEHIYFEPGIQMPDGWLRLEDSGSVVFDGLDAYALPSLLDRFHYAQPGQEIKSFFNQEDPGNPS